MRVDRVAEGRIYRGRPRLPETAQLLRYRVNITTVDPARAVLFRRFTKDGSRARWVELAGNPYYFARYGATEK